MAQLIRGARSSRIAAALAWLGAQQQERHGLKVEIAVRPKDFVLDAECAVLAFQCARELLWNVVKHAQANQATVSYKLEDGELTVEVADDGRGFDPDSRARQMIRRGDNFGLLSSANESSVSAANLKSTSQPGQGTRVRFTLPAPPSEIAPAVTHAPHQRGRP